MCGLKAGKAYCWGSNHMGQLGDGTTTQRLTPVAMSGGYTMSSLAAGLYHACGVQAATGKAYCWGGNYFGQLGDGTTVNRIAPVAVNGSYTFSSLNVGSSFNTCGLEAASGKAYCWGLGAYGQLGDGSAADSALPVAVSGAYAFSSLTMGQEHACGVQVLTGAAFCWGSNDYGQLGDGNTNQSLVPVAVSGGYSFSSLTAGRYHCCGVQVATGAAFCWGQMTMGSLVMGPRPRASLPSL